MTDTESGSDMIDSDAEDQTQTEHNPGSQSDNECTGFEGDAALTDESRTPLFCGSNLSRLDTTLMLMNVCRTHKVTNECISELLHLFSKVILPTPNSLPTSEGIATNMLSALGLKYDAIDACKNGCILYRNEFAENYGNMSGMQRTQIQKSQYVDSAKQGVEALPIDSET